MRRDAEVTVSFGSITIIRIVLFRDDGTRYFMWGQTYYDIMQKAVAGQDWKTAIDKSAGYGLNKIRMHVYAQGDYRNKDDEGGYVSPYPDAQPYKGTRTKPDRDSLNLHYWKVLDEIVPYLASKSLVADLIITNPYMRNRQFGTDEQNDRFVRYVVARYAAYPNVIWCLANEYNYAANLDFKYPQDQADFNRFGQIIRKSDPWMASDSMLRPLSTHQGTKIDFDFFTASWPTHAVIQYGTAQSGDEELQTSGATRASRGILVVRCR